MKTPHIFLLAAIGFAALLTAPPRAAQAQDAASLPNDGVISLDPVTVTGTKSGVPVYDSLSGSSVVTRDEMGSRLQPDSTADILRLVPGVTTQAASGDPGLGVNVRGLQDFGRVNVLVDGARQNFQREGHSAKGTFYFDPEMMKSVDVTRGPISSVYGSGAIGGVVSFTTIDAGDILNRGEWIGAKLKTSYETNGRAPLLHGEVAAQPNEALDVLGAATWRSSADYFDGHGEKVPYTAQDLLSGLLKSRIRPADDHEITLSALRVGNEFNSGLSTIYNTRAVADTLTAGYRFTPDLPFWDLSAKIYYASTNVEQTVIEGTPIGGLKSFEIGTTGFDVFNTSRFETGTFFHELTYGGDLFQDRVDTIDTFGTSAQLTPSGVRLVYGSFVQDRIRYKDWLEVIGALRHDFYRLSGNGIVNEGTRLSPKLTVGITPWQPVTFYGTYAEGYRAPSLIETLIEGVHPPPVSAGRFIPNPDLRAEIAHNVEAGVNLRFDSVFAPDDALRMKVSAFHNRVDDYIEQIFTPFPIPGGYQYRNIMQAAIQGVEAEGFYDAGNYYVGLSGHIIEGKNRLTDEELNKVPPNRLTATLGLRTLDGKLEFGTRMTLVGEKKKAEALGFVGDGYAVVDLFASWQVNERMTAGLVVENLLDRRYTEYLNGQPSAGINAKASLSIRLN